MDDARPLAEVLAEYVGASGLSRRYTLRDVLAAWPAAVGKEAADHCEITAVKRGVLQVTVDSAACLQELANFRKSDILAELIRHKGCGKIYDVEFRLGKVERGK